MFRGEISLRVPILEDEVPTLFELVNQSNSQGATDPDVQAEEDPSKERAWELFTG